MKRRDIELQFETFGHDEAHLIKHFRVKNIFINTSMAGMYGVILTIKDKRKVGPKFYSEIENI